MVGSGIVYKHAETISMNKIKVFGLNIIKTYILLCFL